MLDKNISNFIFYQLEFSAILRGTKFSVILVCQFPYLDNLQDIEFIP